MSDIFISYASDDRKRIMPLVRALENTGWSVFWDRTIPTGKHWRQVIGKEIRNCRSIIVVWSENSVDSDYVQEEAEEGKQRGILFPVMIDDVLPPFGFSAIQAQNLTEWNGKVPYPAYDRLVNDIKTLLGTPPITADERKQKKGEHKRKKEQERKGFEELIPKDFSEDKAKAIDRADIYETPEPSVHPKLRKTSGSRRLILTFAVIFITFFAIIIVFQIMKTSTHEEFDQSVEIPPGEFLYGEDRIKEGFSAPFSIDVYPVTNSQYKKFVASGGYDNNDYWSDAGREWRENNKVTQPKYWDNPKWNRPDFPVVGVSYFEAEAYAKWAGKRLPAEQEWERAARGTDGREYPWGNIFDEERCNTKESGIDKTSRVDQYPKGRSPSGCYDMAGNVWEWTKSWYNDKNEARVLRGGSWVGDSSKARCSTRVCNSPDYRAQDVGFRCVKDKS